jgi:hypothetical protein
MIAHEIGIPCMDKGFQAWAAGVEAVACSNGMCVCSGQILISGTLGSIVVRWFSPVLLEQEPAEEPRPLRKPSDGFGSER